MDYCQETKSHHKLINIVLMLAICGSVQIEAQAALPSDAILAFDPGETVCLSGGTPPSCYYGQDVIAGSYFAMDTNGDGLFSGNEKLAIEMQVGVRLGDVQPASGSHSGSPDGSESPTIDMPWTFFGNTGMHQTTLPVVIVNGDDGSGDNTATLDFAGWGLTWNGIPNVPLGGDSANFPSDTGVAIVNCSSGCNIGDSFTLDHFAHVPLGDPSGFGGVYYTVHLEGVINPGSPLPPTRKVSIQLTGGNSQECSSFDGKVIEATVNITTTDINDIVSVNWELDGAAVGSGDSIAVAASLGDHTLSVYVDTLASGSFDSSEPVTVKDTTPPELDIHFIDLRTGDEITEVTGDGKNYVSVRYDVVDVCDPASTATGTAVPVHTIDDGDIMLIDKKKLATTTLGSSAVQVSAEATDATGNRRQRGATLLIAD